MPVNSLSLYLSEPRKGSDTAAAAAAAAADVGRVNESILRPHVQKLAGNRRSQGDRTEKSEMLANRKIARRNTLSSATYSRELASQSSSDSLSCHRESVPETASRMDFLSLSPQVTPKFGAKGAGSRTPTPTPVSPSKKFDWPLRRIGSMSGRGILSKMSEGRLMHVLLLDDQKLEIVVQPKLYASELHDMAASHLRLKEKDYFGLTFRDETGHYQWLKLDKRVLEHDFPRRTGPLVLYFQVRLYIDSITYLRDSITVKLFYLQAIQSMYKGQIECDSETVFELAAYVLQATHGDYVDDSTTVMQMKKLMLLSTSVLKQHPSLAYCEDQIIGFYKSLKGHTVGSATVNYMSIVESIPTYGIHYYEVKDKTGIPWWLGISFRGVSVYDHADKRIPRKNFAWKLLENLYFREKKFSIEVVDLKKNTSGSVTVNVHSWMASTAQLAECIWKMTVCQHQFYLNRMHRKSVSMPMPARSLSEIADDINRTLENSDKMTGSEAEPDVISSSSSSFICSKADLLQAKELEAMKIARQETYHKLKTRKDELQQELFTRITKLRELCLKEAELTGIVPAELPLMPGESLPQVRKRIGTTFVLSPKFFNEGTLTGEDQLKKLEMEFEIQEKIIEAEMHLAQDKALPKTVRKKHRRSYRHAYQKLKELESKINTLREKAGREERIVVNARSLDDLSEDSREFLDDDVEVDSCSTPLPTPTPADSESQPQKLIHNYYRRYTHHELSSLLRFPSCGTPKAEKELNAPQFFLPGEGNIAWSNSVEDDSPSSSAIRFYPKKMAQSLLSSRSSPCGVETSSVTPSPSSRVQPDGCSLSSTQSSENQYQMNQSFFSKRKQSSSSIGSDFTNSCSSSLSSLQQSSLVEREENLYNINTFLTGCYESGDELRNAPEESCQQHWSTKHGSLDRRQNAHNRFDGNCLSGSLELPESAVTKFSSKPESAADNSPVNNIRLSRKNGSERSHDRSRDKLADQNVHTKGPLTPHFYHFPGSLDRPTPSSPSHLKLQHLGTPMLHIASPKGRRLESQISSESLQVPRMNTMPVPHRSFCTSADNSAVGHELRTECEDKLSESQIIDVLDSPEKLMIFRKERYGRGMAGNRTPLPQGHNKDAVDALFRHHEETVNFGADAEPSPQIVSSPSSSALFQSNELS